MKLLLLKLDSVVINRFCPTMWLRIKKTLLDCVSHTETLFDTNQSRVTLLSKILGSTKPVNLLL